MSVFTDVSIFLRNTSIGKKKLEGMFIWKVSSASAGNNYVIFTENRTKNDVQGYVNSGCNFIFTL